MDKKLVFNIGISVALILLFAFLVALRLRRRNRTIKMFAEAERILDLMEAATNDADLKEIRQRAIMLYEDYGSQVGYKEVNQILDRAYRDTQMHVSLLKSN
jgi:hypothetical protein